MANAFQRSAFQNNAFQFGTGTVSPVPVDLGGAGWVSGSNRGRRYRDPANYFGIFAALRRRLEADKRKEAKRVAVLERQARELEAPDTEPDRQAELRQAITTELLDLSRTLPATIFSPELAAMIRRRLEDEQEEEEIEILMLTLH